MQTQNIAYRVFIFGVEVTPRIVSVELSNPDDGSPGSCSIVLASDRNLFEFVEGEEKTARFAGESEPEMQLAEAVDRMIQRKLEAKVAPLNVLTEDQRQNASAAVGLGQVVSASRGGELWAIAEEEREEQPSAYEFRHLDSVFHATDPVRVAATHQGRWFWRFSGRVMSSRVERSYYDGTTTLSIDGLDVRQSLAYTRVTNAGILQLGQVTSDITRRPISQNFWSGLTLPEAIFAAVFGTSVSEILQDLAAADDERFDVPKGPRIFRGAYGPEQRKEVNLRSAGSFLRERSSVFLFTESERSPTVAQLRDRIRNTIDLRRRDAPEDTLVEYEVNVPPGPRGLSSYLAAVSEQVAVDDLSLMLGVPDQADWWIDDLDEELAREVRGGWRPATEGRALSPRDVVGFIGRHPELYHTDGYRLVVAVPLLFKILRNITSFSSNTVGLHNVYTQRMQSLEQLLSPLDFSIHANGRGDLLFEFPFRDFKPVDFEAVTWDVANEALNPGRAILARGNERVLDSDVQVVGEESLVSVNRIFNHEAIKNAIRFPVNPVSQIELPRIEITDSLLVNRVSIERYGVREADIKPSLVLSNRAGDLEAARDAGLLFAKLAMAKSEAAANRSAVRFVDDTGGLRPNRIVEVPLERFIGRIYSVRRSFRAYTGEQTLSVDLDLVRSGVVTVEGNLLYQGFVSGFSFRELLGFEGAARRDVIRLSTIVVEVE